MSEALKHLDALRAQLVTLALDGFLVPMADEYQNEYVPACAKRIAFLTGFTGSAGLLLVLRDQAHFFTDSRYTLAAQKHFDAAQMKVHDTEKNMPHEWVKENLASLSKLGFDPWLHSAAALERWTKALADTSVTLVPVERNPVDVIWVDRPAAPATPVVAHPLIYAGEASASKRKRLAADLVKKKIAAAVIASPSSIAWLLNVRATDVPHNPLPLSYAILHTDGRVDWFIDAARLAGDVSSSMGEGVSIHAPAAFTDFLKQFSKKKTRIEKSGTASAICDALKAAEAILDDGPDLCALPQAIKNATELDGMRRAHVRDAVAMARFLAWFENQPNKAKLNELGLEEKLLACRARDPLFRDTSFDAIVGAGGNGAIVHYRATTASNRTIDPNNLLLIDSGAQYPDGTTDITRTLAVGTPTAEMRDRFTRVLKGHIALATAVFPEDTRGSELDGFARRALWEAGVDYRHGTGHGVGSYLSVHEGPHGISRRSDKVALQAGMVVTNEPGYYKAEAFGIRIENMMIVSPAEKVAGGDGPVYRFETITLVPIDVRAIDKTLLTPAETAWLNDYHARVRAEIAPLVEPDVQVWLELATRPI